MENLLSEKDVLTAQNEPKVKSAEILEELLPLFDEFFIGKAVFDGTAVLYYLLNGQTIRICCINE